MQGHLEALEASHQDFKLQVLISTVEDIFTLHHIIN